MNKFVDYLTILQLGVALNLVTGAYASQRREFEDKVANELNDYRDKIRQLLNLEKEQGPIGYELERKDIRQLSDRELSRLQSDVSIRFWRRSYNFGKKDIFFEKALIPIGIFCAMALVVASIWPEEYIAPYIALFISLIAVGVPIYAFVRTYTELREHQLYYRRNTTRNYSDNIEREHDLRMRSSPKKGEIHEIHNALRARFSAKQSRGQKPGSE